MPMNRRFSANALSTKPSTLSSLPISSSVFMTASPAPPWSVPLIAPTPPATAECMSDRVAAITRVVKDEARVEGLGRDVARLLPRQHVEEVGREREVLRRRHGLLAAPDAVVGADG